MKHNIGIKLSVRVAAFLLFVAVVYIFVKKIDNNIFLFLSIAIVLAAGYFFIFKPVKLIENLLDSASGEDYHQGKRPRGLGKTGDNFNLLLDRLMVSRESLNILSAASKTITSRVEIENVINMILDLVYEKMMMSSVHIALQDDDGFIRIKASRGLSGEFIENIRLAPGEGFAGRSFLTKETIIVNDAEKEKLPATEKIVANEGIMSFMHIPIIVDNKAVGIFGVSSKTKRFFDTDIVKTLTTFADYLAIAIGNSNMYQDMQAFNKRLELEVESTTEELTNTNLRLISKVKEMKALNDIIFSASGKTDMDEMFLKAIEKIKAITNVSIAGFMIYNEQTNKLTGCGDLKGFDLHISGDSDALVKSFKNAATFLSNELFIESSSDLQSLYRDYRITSLVALPLIEKKITGLLVLGNKTIGKFSQDDMRFLSVVASQIAELIGRARLYEQLANRVNDLLTLRDISNTIKTEPQLDEILEVIAEKTIRALDSDYAIYWFLDETGKKLIPKFPPDYINRQEINLNIKSSSRILKYFLEDKIKSLTNIEFQNELYSLKELLGVQSYLFVPLKVEEKKIGLFCICSKKQNFFNEDRVRLAELIANQAAVIVENARIYKQLKEINIELERLNNVKNDFISMVSHELRTPLTAIKGFVHVVLNQEAGKINEQQKKFLGITMQSINHLNMLISDLLDLSKIESGLITLKLERINLSDVVGKALETNINQIRNKDIELRIDIDKDLPEIEGDHSRLLQVYNNLISNATKFTGNKGRITITVKDKGDYIISTVADNGIGISKKEHQKIFEKFYQVDFSYTRPATGTGLGLFVVRTIVELHGGNIWIDSSLGKGTTFSFLLPKIKRTSMKKAVKAGKKTNKTFRNT